MLSQEEWGKILEDAANLLRHELGPFVTPISGEQEDETGIHVGTGGYVEWRRRRLLLTNKHVMDKSKKQPLACKFFDSTSYIRIDKFLSVGAPEDLAVSAVDDRWGVVPHSAKAFPCERMEEKHAPLQGEFLFVMGFTGKKSYFSPFSAELFTPGTPYLTQQYDYSLEPEEARHPINHPNFNSTYHFALFWHPEKMTATDGKTSSIPIDPCGMSGSFVWNTRILEFLNNNRKWTPEVARLTGIIWGWDQKNRYLFATKIEHITSFLTRIYP